MPEWAKGITRATLLAASFFALGAGQAAAGSAQSARAPLAGERAEVQAQAPAGTGTPLPGGRPPAAADDGAAGPAMPVRTATRADTATRVTATREDTAVSAPGGAANVAGAGDERGGDRVPPAAAAPGVRGPATPAGHDEASGAPVNAAPVRVCGRTADFGTAVAGCRGGAPAGSAATRRHAVSRGHDKGGAPAGTRAVRGDDPAGASENGPRGVAADGLAVDCGRFPRDIAGPVAGQKAGDTARRAATDTDGHTTGAAGRRTRGHAGRRTRGDAGGHAGRHAAGDAAGDAFGGAIGGAIGHAADAAGTAASTAAGEGDATGDPGTVCGPRAGRISPAAGPGRVPDLGEAGREPPASPAGGATSTCGSAAAVLGDAAAGCANIIFPVRRGVQDTRADGPGRPGGVPEAPATAPIDSCHGAVAVFARPGAGCGGRCAHPRRAGAARELSELPQLPATATISPVEAVPANPGALPALPRLSIRFRRFEYRPAGLAGSTGPPAAAPGESGTNEIAARTVPGARGLTRPGTESAPEPPSRTAAISGAPAGSGSAPPDGGTGSLAGGVPRATGRSGAPARWSPMAGTASAAHGPADLPARLPGTLPNLPPMMFGHPWHPPVQPAARSLPDLPSVPVVMPVPQAGSVLPVHRHGAPPSVGGPPKPFPPLRDAAAQPGSRVESGALTALALAALLAATSGAISLARRLRAR